MKRLCLFALVILLGVGVALTGCGSKKGQSGLATDIKGDESVPAFDLGAVDWSYETEPKPAIVGTPDFRLVSFGFDKESVLMKKEAKAACKESLKKLAENADARLVVIGFADGVGEKANAGSLGMRRAHTVVQFLIAQGIGKERVQATSFGDAYSTARADEKIKQSRERKVEIWALK